MQSSSKMTVTGASWLITAVFMLSNSPTPLYSFWQHQFGYSSGMLTVIFALYIAGLLGTLLFAGQLSDRYGRKPLLLPGLAAAMIASLLFATAESVAALAVARLLTGIAVGIMVSAGMAGVADLSGPLLRKQAALLASVAMVTGAGTGPLISGMLIQTLTHPVIPLFLLLFCALLVAIIIAVRLPFAPRGATTSGSLRLTLPFLPAKNISALLCGIGAFAPGITATSFILALGPSLLTLLAHSYNPLLAGIMTCGMFICATLTQVQARRWPLSRVFFGSSLATVLSMVLVVVAITLHEYPWLIFGVLLAGAGQGLGQFGGLTLLALQVEDRRRAQANALLNIGGYLPAGILPVVAGYLTDKQGLSVSAMLFALLLTLFALTGGIFAQRFLRSAPENVAVV
ncbi:MFS transporter [Tatumella sp. UBA2305]|uniref:MFS transporter n=1 Tax=Tatumella sp. UBA2305 TaxID=1947647 RepID=UPI0025D602EB|nr:MFS transporter [Tatumella sp. UBA2305]